MRIKPKSPFFSKTIHFNFISGVLIPIIWPFLPKHFREQDYAIYVLTGYFTLANIALRFLVKETIHRLEIFKNKDLK